MRKLIFIPAIALAVGLFISETAQAQPPRPPGPGPGGPGPGGPGPGFRPGMPPPPPFMRPGPGGIAMRPGPGIGIGINIGPPIPSYPLYPYYPPPRPPVLIVDPVYDRYNVLYRECSQDPWRSYRVYESRRLALITADQLRDMGYETSVLRD